MDILSAKWRAKNNAFYPLFTGKRPYRKYPSTLYWNLRY